MIVQKGARWAPFVFLGATSSQQAFAPFFARRAPRVPAPVEATAVGTWICTDISQTSYSWCRQRRRLLLLEFCLL